MARYAVAVLLRRSEDDQQVLTNQLYLLKAESQAEADAKASKRALKANPGMEIVSVTSVYVDEPG